MKEIKYKVAGMFYKTPCPLEKGTPSFITSVGSSRCRACENFKSDNEETQTVTCKGE